MQFLRILLPSFRYYLRDTLGISSLNLAPIALAVFALSLLAIPVLRLIGVRRALGISIVGLALLRLLAQFSAQASVDLLVSAAGVTLFVFFLIYTAGLVRHKGRGGQFAFFFLFGVGLDTAIHTVAGTLDLVWQFGTIPIAAILILTLALAVAFRWAIKDGSITELDEVSWRLAWPLIAIGPWFVLQMLAFQNVGRLAALSGLSLPLAGLLVALGNTAGLALALWALRSDRTPSWLAALSGILLVLAVLPHETAGAPGVAATLLGQAVSFLLLEVLFLHLGKGVPSRSLPRTSLAVFAGMEILVLGTFLYYASYDISLGFRSPAVMPVVAAVVALGGWAASRRAVEPDPGRAPFPYSYAGLGLILLASPLILLTSWDEPQAVQPPSDGAPLRLMTYNLHQGYSAAGRMEIEAQARLIEEAGADVIALQEVSRGYVISGSTDMIEWLSQRLGMPYVYGPTADPLWGNALLSRYPILSASLHPLPPSDLLLQRGFIDAEIEYSQEPIRLLATHYHHPDDGSEIRQEQAQEMLEAWGGTPRTILLGDLNARPTDPEMLLLSGAGFSDALAGVSPPSSYTYSAADPYQQIDYIWFTPDFRLQSASVPASPYSDHLPVLAEVEAGN
jgi:endonuclease/exonuclease/phosphatase family metal-dependent hydrolase